LDALLRDGEIEASEWRRLAVPPQTEQDAASGSVDDLLVQEAAIRDEPRIEDAERETLDALVQIRAAVAGEIADADGVRAAQAAIRRVFSHFVLHESVRGPGYASLRPVPHASMVEQEYLVYRPDGTVLGRIEGAETLRRVPIGAQVRSNTSPR
jgi:hypothetical protein